MKAHKVNETQSFKRGENPYKALDIGLDSYTHDYDAPIELQVTDLENFIWYGDSTADTTKRISPKILEEWNDFVEGIFSQSLAEGWDALESDYINQCIEYGLNLLRKYNQLDE